MTCPVCGYTFKDYKYVCEGCILHNGCELVCCPNCHYQFPAQSKVVNFISRIFKSEKPDAPKRD